MRKRASRARGRRWAYRRGRLGETLCAFILRLKGYRILARGYRTPVGEIDIIAKRGSLLAIVEVKVRGNLAQAAQAVTPRQQGRVRRATLMYLAAHPECAGLDVRFDVMLVVPRRPPSHIMGAWGI